MIENFSDLREIFLQRLSPDFSYFVYRWRFLIKTIITIIIIVIIACTGVWVAVTASDLQRLFLDGRRDVEGGYRREDRVEAECALAAEFSGLGGRVAARGWPWPGGWINSEAACLVYGVYMCLSRCNSSNILVSLSNPFSYFHLSSSLSLQVQLCAYVAVVVARYIII